MASTGHFQFKSKDYNIIENKNHREIHFFHERFLEKLYVFFNIRKLDLELKKNQINNLTKQVILRDGKRIYSNNQ